jgi:APA family basic amino acid/polyamine antiporter
MPQLEQKLTLFDMTMIAIGSTIGSGIFLTPALIANALSSPFWILLVWGIGGLLALSGALTFAELGAMMPRAGGVYVYLTEAYGGLVGFLYGWAYFLVVNTGGIAALSVAFATYFGYFVPLSPAGLKIAAIVGIIIVTVINVLGVKAGGVFSDVFTVLKLAGIIGLIAVGLTWGSSATTDFAAPLGDLSKGLGGALAVAMVGVLWSYGGWQHATFTAGEAKEAKRTVPQAMILGALAVTVIYLLTNIAYMFLLSPAQIGASPRVAAEAVEIIFGPVGASLIALAAASVFRFRKRSPEVERSYKTPGYPLTPLFFVTLSVWFILNTLVEKPAQAWTGIGFLALGVPVYYFWKMKPEKSNCKRE